MGFLGRADYLLDDKKRVPMPPKYRVSFDAPAILTTGEDPCVSVYTQDGFDAAGAEVTARTNNDEDGRRIRRKFFGNAEPVAKDAQGRLLVPQRLIDYAGLGRDVVVVGMDDHFEIWDRDKLAAFEG
ncbi:MAG: hypothetical protein HYX53_08940 [Chloroflexi bacterium]|nr:hypothetical protein [Chloroflexota bacterium]